MAPRRILPGAAARPRAALLGAFAAVLAFCAGDAAARSYPFGPHTRDVNDLGNQFVPYHAHLWDLLHGRADGGILLNWQSGYGTSFLPDLGTYLSSPFALLVGLFPRDRVDLAVYLITALKIASAAAAMACLLPALRPGRWWAAGALGASYAMCGWTVTMGSYNTMWLDGLIAFPLLCLVAEWAREGRRPVLSAGVVALCWTANFYTAYMATIGAALVLAARLLAEPGTTRRQWLTSTARASRAVLLGVGLTAPLLLTIVKGTELAYPGAVRDFGPAPWADLLARTLPGTYGFMSPSTYVDTVALLLVFVLPFHRAVPRRTRTVWTLLVAAVTLSLQWKPTHLLWHAFATPNGSPFRQTFVLSGVMVIAGWLALSHGLPGPRPIAWGAGVLGLLGVVAAVGAQAGVAGPGTYPVALAGLVLAVGALLSLRRAQRVRRALPAVLAVGVLLAVQVGQSAFSDAWADRKRIETMDDYAEWGRRQQWQREVVAGADAWPGLRTDPGRAQTVGNDPLEVGGQGAAYYSSLTPDVWTSTLAALGGGWTSHGRSLQSLDSPVTDVIFSVGARVHSPPDPHLRGNPPQTVPPTVTRQPVPPLVTVHGAPAGGYGPSPYRNQELLLGGTVYRTPGPVTVFDGAGHRVLPDRTGFHMTGGHTGAARGAYTVRTSCPSGDQIYFFAPSLMGTVQQPGHAAVTYVGRMPSHRAAVARVGTAPAGGQVALRVRALEPGVFGAGAVGCLDATRLAEVERRTAATAATAVHVTDDGVSARLPAGAHGYAVVAAPAIDGWRCSAGNGGTHPGGSYLGLLSVPLPADGSATSLSCVFTPPGLRLGEAVGGVSLLGVAGLAGYGWWRGRRRPGTPDDGDGGRSTGTVAAVLVEG